MKDRDRVLIQLPNENAVVTGEYLRAIGRAYEASGMQVAYTSDSLRTTRPDTDIYVVAEATTATCLIVSGAEKVVFWAQGIWPEESRERHASHLRYRVCSTIERFALRRATKVFMVSEEMLFHFESKYDLVLENKTFIMPCSNETLHPQSFFRSGKYSAPTFIYAGSLASHQCVPEMLDVFAEIQDVLPQATLLLLTFDKVQAQKLVDGRQLSGIVVETVEHSRLENTLTGIKYGFILRQNSLVNRVSTPTKISTYLANGIVPIFSGSIASFRRAAIDLRYVIEYRPQTFIDDLMRFEEKVLSPEGVCDEYSAYFSENLDYSQKAEAILEFLTEAE